MAESVRTLTDGILAIQRRWPHLVVESEAEPIFVLAAGWRSGSTWLQRLLFPTCLVWGEPLGHALPIQSMAAPLRCITERWPEPHFFYRGEPLEPLSRQFVANLFPTMEHWVRAQQAWFHEWVERPAREAGATRWGLKEVRFTMDEAHYLKWLFPRAKFIFLHRNPFDAWRSFVARRNVGWHWYYRWPDTPLTVELFGRLWTEQVAGFVERHQEVGGLVVRYDDLVRGHVQPIEDYLGFHVNHDALQSNPSDTGPREPADLDSTERERLMWEAGDWAVRLGYEPASTETSVLGTVSITVSPASNHCL